MRLPTSMFERTSVALSVVAALTVPAAAQQPAGPEFRVDSSTTDVNAPAVASDAEGDFVVVWAYGYQSGDVEIRGQRFNSFGSKYGAKFVVNTVTPASQFDPAIAANASGSFVVVWTSQVGDGSSTGIVGRRFDSVGAPLDPSEFQVNAYTTSHQIRPRVAMDSSGRFVVIWNSVGQDGSSWGIFGRRFDAVGAPVGADFQVNAYTAGVQARPAVATTSDGGFVVSWESQSQDGSAYAVVARRFDAAGDPVGLEFQVNTYTTGYQMLSDVAVDGAGGFGVVWGSFEQDGSDWGVFGQRFDSSGTPLGAEFTVNTHSHGRQAFPAIAKDPSGSFIVTWHSSGQLHYHDVFGQRFDAAGGRIGSEFLVNTYTTLDQASPSVAALGNGNFVVAWASFPSPSNPDWGRAGIYAQRYGELLFRDGFETGDTYRVTAVGP